MSRRKLVSLISAGAIAALAFPFSCGRDSGPEANAPPVFTTAPAYAQLQAPPGGGQWLAEVAERSVESVVNIASNRKPKIDPRQHPLFGDPLFREFFGRELEQMPKERAERSLGSGVIVSEDGLVLTNNHVVANADEIRVTLHGGKEVTAKLLGTDPPSDLAVLKIDNPPRDLKPLTFGDSGALRLGEFVLAIGDPFGVGKTVTMGIVSAKGRANMGIVDYEDFIQTDAAINPGNSGGALINTRGELVGVNTAIISRTGGYQGIGFAIPSNMVRPIMDALAKNGKVVRGWLGVAIQEVTPEIAETMNLPSSKGVLVSDVSEDGPGAKAGLKAGDVILSVAGEEVNSTARLRNLVASIGPNKDVELQVLRDRDVKKMKVRLGELKKAAAETLSPGGDREVEGPIGLEVAPLDDRARRELRLEARHGVVVVGVAPGSPAQEAGLQPRDVILEVNREKVESPKDLERGIERSGPRVLLRVLRDRTSVFVIIRK
jgi:serine protease Do